jgi:NAD(P)-dependent dehydrogenase (short-subunit alcohol dehydrogenase family)
MDIALCYRRSREEAEAVAETARSVGRRAAVIQADLTRPEDCRTLIDRTVAELGRLDVLINMASVYARVDLDAIDDRVWDAVVDVDLRAAFLCAKAALPHLRASGAGRIINFTDWIAASGRPRYKGYLPYYVAKRGVIGLTEALSLELARENILVNAIAPGPILPPEGTDDEEFAKVEAATPLGRWGGEAEIVRAVAFLLESDYVTGETIRVDGGRHIR